MRPRGSPEQLQERRERAIALLDQGLRPVDVARRLGVERRSVRRWKAAYRIKGTSGIKAKAASGRPPKLAPEQKRKLEKILVRGAAAAGFSTDLWTCPRIARVVRERFRVDYHVDHIGRLLRSLGWSLQKPQRRAVERDEDAIRQWVQKEWPRIKKKPRA